MPSTTLADLLPLSPAAAIFLGTFILEDVAAVGAGLLLAAGSLSWPVAFWACFLGIWMGDAGLYALARFGGRSWFERSRFNRFAARVAQSEQWFHERGNLIHIFSRLLPGARLPTYLAAGFLRLPLKRFLLITGAASLVWTLVLLRVTQVASAAALDWAKQWQHGGWLLLAALAAVWLVVALIRRRASRWAMGAVFRPLREGFLTLLGRWTQWEFWPGWLFYPPVALWCLWLAVKHRGLTLPTSANPGIFAGGVVGESKFATLTELSRTCPEFTAQAWRLEAGSSDARFTTLLDLILCHAVTYPFILKPDLGQRGAGVKLIRCEEQALAYLRQTDAPLVAQRYAPGPHEVGVFYYRFPHEERGRIFAITEKIFPVIVGDGESTVAELIQSDPRARLIAKTYLRRFAARRSEVLAAGEVLKLVESGNHAQGCIFRDGARLETPELAARIDEISRKLNEFFIGRYDIRYGSESDLRAGRNFQIVELNGAAAEATNIYDARNSLLAAYGTLFRQWELVFAIGAANRALGTAPMGAREAWRAWRSFAKLAENYPTAD